MNYKKGFNMFDTVRKHFGYGLVKLSSDFKILDKNEKADEYRLFPKRGASVLKFTKDVDKITSLSFIEGDNALITFCDGIKRIQALVIRERSGKMLVLLHPLICSMAFSRGGKAPIAYGINILNVIYGERIEKSISPEEIFPFSSFSVKELTLVTTAVSKIVEKINKLKNMWHTFSVCRIFYPSKHDF